MTTKPRSSRDAGLVVPEPVGDRAAADGDEQQVGLDGVAVLEGDRHGVAGLGRAGELHPGLNAILRLRKDRSSMLGDGLVLGGDEPGQRLDDGHLGAERAEHGGELDADDAAAEHDDARRDEVERERLLAGHDPAADLETGQRLGVASPVARTTLRPRTWRPPTSTVRAVDQAPGALDELDLVGLDQPLQALVEPGDHAVLVGVDAGHVDRLEGRLARRTVSPSRAVSATSAACSSALVGMHPTCRQVPPSLSFSTSATDSPSSAARNAQA